MILSKIPRLTPVAAACLLLATAHTSQTQKQTEGRFTKPVLGIEVIQKKSFFLQAATSNKISSVIIEVPPQAKAGKGAAQDPVSALKLEPKVEKGKVRVTVYALYGDIKGIKRCEDLDALRAVEVDSFVAGPGQERRVSKLKKFEVRMENDPFTIRVTTKSIFGPLDPEGGGCPCLECELAVCCPNPGFCAPCQCGTICCRSNN